MSTDYFKLVEREESALFVSLISRGFQSKHFRAGLGWDYGVAHHRYRDRGHYISIADRSAARETILAAMGRESDFWDDYIARCNRAGTELMATASRLGGRDWGSADRPELLDGFMAFAEATMDMVPFLMATVAVQPILEDQLVQAIASEMTGPDSEERARRVLPRLLIPSQDPDAVQEIRSAQRLALQALTVPGLPALIDSETPPAVMIADIHDRYRLFYDEATAHVAQFGWLRTHGYRFEPLTVEELFERIAGTIRRWDATELAQAHASRPDFNLDNVLGFSPSAGLLRLIGQLSELIHLRFYRIDVHLQADCEARPLFRAVAEHLGCTRDELIFASVDELRSSLSHGDSLDINEIRARAANWFELERDGDELELHSLSSPLQVESDTKLPAEGLLGLTASSGLASGQAKVLFGADEVSKVDRGDILVTTMTTPDLMLAIEKAGAIVTDEGGILSHAAIISREIGVPCVIGTERATRAFVDGEVLEVDATQPDGRVRRIGQA